MAALYADENVRIQLVQALRGLGHDVLRAQEDGRGNQHVPDPNVIARATALGRAVLTNNRRHYHRLHGLIPNHAGIITFTTDPDDAALAHRIEAAIRAAPNLVGLLIRITRSPRP